MLRGPYGMLKIKPVSVVWKANTLLLFCFNIVQIQNNCFWRQGWVSPKYCSGGITIKTLKKTDPRPRGMDQWSCRVVRHCFWWCMRDHEMLGTKLGTFTSEVYAPVLITMFPAFLLLLLMREKAGWLSLSRTYSGNYAASPRYPVTWFQGGTHSRSKACRHEQLQILTRDKEQRFRPVFTLALLSVFYWGNPRSLRARTCVDSSLDHSPALRALHHCPCACLGGSPFPLDERTLFLCLVLGLPTTWQVELGVGCPVDTYVQDCDYVSPSLQLDLLFQTLFFLPCLHKWESKWVSSWSLKPNTEVQVF